mgnify:CR=1 FL=1
MKLVTAKEARQLIVLAGALSKRPKPFDEADLEMVYSLAVTSIRELAETVLVLYQRIAELEKQVALGARTSPLRKKEYSTEGLPPDWAGRIIK